MPTALNSKPDEVELEGLLLPKGNHEPPVDPERRAYPALPISPGPSIDHDMRREKGRRYLYLALYDDTRLSGQSLRIHWALILAPVPKYEDPHSFAKTNTLFHVTNKNGHWDLERRPIECVRTPAMLGRVFLGTVEKWHVSKVEKRLADTGKMRTACAWWDCQRWVEEALIDLSREQWLQLGGLIQLNHLFAFAQQFGEGVVTKGMNVGFDKPITVDYPGPGPLPSKIIK